MYYKLNDIKYSRGILHLWAIKIKKNRREVFVHYTRDMKLTCLCNENKTVVNISWRHIINFTI